MTMTCQAVRSTRVRKIAIFGNIGTQNLGDEATIAAVIQNLRRRDPDIDIRAFVINPRDTRERFRIPAFAQRRGFHGSPSVKRRQPDNQTRVVTRLAVRYNRAKAVVRRVPFLYSSLAAIRSYPKLLVGLFGELAFVIHSASRLAGAELLIVAGSGQLLDYWGGPWKYPYTCLRWVLIARVLGAKVAFVSVGAGPISSSLSRALFKCSLSLGCYRSYRDDTSRKLIEDLGVCGEHHVFPDLVYSLAVDDTPPAPGKSPRRRVGINAIPYFDNRFWPESDAAVYNGYVHTMASFALWLIETGHDIVFFPTQLRMDPFVIQDIKHVMEREGGSQSMHRVTDRPIHTVEDLVDQISAMDVVVAARFHGVLIAYLLNKPVLGISYHRKTEELITEMGQADYIVDIKHCSLDHLIKAFLSLESNAAGVKQEIERRALDHRLALDKQYDRVLGLLGQEAEVVRSRIPRKVEP
jgi:polysaccharide pyruvyl transferase WcaK-like protein